MILKTSVDNKTIVWFQKNNQYIIVEPIVADIISLLNDNVSVTEIVNELSSKINNTTQQELIDFINEVSKLLTTDVTQDEKKSFVKVPKKINDNIFYKINNIIIKVSYLSDYEKFLVHPKFAHLVTNQTTNYQHHYKVFSNENYISFSVDDKVVDTWNLKDVHYFQGKFSMKITEHIHSKTEDEWLGVFHASAVSNQKNTILFLGDSGNGKSTSLALLQTNGFTCLADDFVPISSIKQHVYSFPSAISIKKNSLLTLLPIYPELENSAEYHFKKLNKIVRYLTPNNPDYNQNLPCKALVFIKYEKNSDLQFSKISSINAFEKLVPDSWLSPKPENAKIFLEWFKQLPCYQLTYSNNKKMTKTVHKIFNNDL